MKSSPQGTVKKIKAWAVIDARGDIPQGIYQEKEIYRIYSNRRSANGGKFEMFERQKIVPVTITLPTSKSRKRS